ncbi:MAG: ABC transporter ATP-binding protein/permease, partial [Anaerolineaceae bacterium]|nr:ABC transporter ATP-binding protein/permease [Anaerolineaceae bacterium]
KCYNSVDMKPMKLLGNFAKKYTGSLILAILSMLALVGAQLLIPWLIRTLINALTVDNLTQATLDLITKLTIVAFLVFLARGVMQFIRSYSAHIAGWGVVSDARKFVYDHLQRLSLRYYEDKQTGQLMSRVVNDTDLFEKMISHAVPEVFVNIISLFGISAVLFSMNWQLTLMSMIPIPLVIVALILYAKIVRPAFRWRQRELGELNAILNDNISGVREIKAFTREYIELTRVGNGIENYRRSQMKALKLMAIFQPFMDFSSSLGQLLVIFFGGRLAYQGLLSVADLVAFFLYLESFYQPIRNLGNAWEQVQESMAGFERIAELLTEEVDVSNPKHVIALPSSAQGEINFTNVCFKYQEGEPVLKDINLKIEANSVVALVGPTGVGKSTLVSLIPRFYDVTEGSIQLDGKDLRELDLKDLRSQISIVLQEVFLFHGTVRDNILFGNPKATDKEIVDAAIVANAHEFIMQLPEKYETLIGERGVKLSGGQRQRLSIARAVLKNTPILILDEATSSVDTETELLIQQALERLMMGRTTIIIAHRLSTVQKADKIVVLEGSRITEIGTHAELLNKHGLYHRLFTVQQRLQ